MSSESDPGALEDVAYLSRSENRVAILDALARRPYPRRELGEETGVSRTTLDRIVNELESRGWAERTADGEYVATTTGRHLVAELRPFLDAVEAVRRLGDALAWLPENLDIGLQHFSDATVRRPEGEDPMETIDYFVELASQASEITVLTHLSPPVPLSRVIRDRIVAGELRGTFIITGGCIDLLREHADRRRRWQEVLDAGGDIYRYEDHVPCNLYRFDGTVLIKKSAPEPFQDAYGIPIQTENPTVRVWAEDLLADHRNAATRVERESFREPESP